LKVKQANLSAAEAQLTKLKQMPRPEEVPPSEARVAEAEAVLVEKEDKLNRGLLLIKKNALAQEELVSCQQAAKVAQAQLHKAKADLVLLKKGAWQPDIKIAEAAVLQAQSLLEQTHTELDRHTIKAPVDGEVLKVDVRPGEYAGAPPSKALIVLGGLKVLHVRVDIDEHDIPRFQPGAPAVAKLRGNAHMELNLTFVRVEPYVVPKKSLTGDNTERVDTRVLQVIYAIDQAKYPVYVGQQLDVFIQSTTPALGHN
jgi:multidrug resistance efflux pump